MLVEEVAEIETRLKSMLNLLDDKVKHLGESSQAWGALSDKIEDMRGWMKGAQKALQQLLSSDLSPEDKLRKTKGEGNKLIYLKDPQTLISNCFVLFSSEFQAEIGRRMGMLQALEKQAQDLLQSDLSQQPPPDKASISNKPVETPIFLQHVDTLKDQLINLHDTVATQNAVTTQTMAALKECKAELSQVTPWLEKAEVKVRHFPSFLSILAFKPKLLLYFRWLWDGENLLAWETLGNLLPNSLNFPQNAQLNKEKYLTPPKEPLL